MLNVFKKKRLNKEFQTQYELMDLSLRSMLYWTNQYIEGDHSEYVRDMIYQWKEEYDCYRRKVQTTLDALRRL